MVETLLDAASAQQIMTDVGAEELLSRLKAYIDGLVTSESSARTTAISNLQQQLNTLVGSGDDLDKIINTFNEIKAFLSAYSEDDTLKSLLDAIDTAISTEATRAGQAETALGERITNEANRAAGVESSLGGRIAALENVEVMTVADADALFDSIFNPQSSGS